MVADSMSTMDQQAQGGNGTSVMPAGAGLQRKRTTSLDRRLQTDGDSDGSIARTGSAPPRSRQQDSELPQEDSSQTDTKADPVPLGHTEPKDVSAGADEAIPPQVETLLADGLRVHKDRILLLRSDLEIEKFVNDASSTRLRIAPPAFPPALNSYQRLLIHRLADTWNVARELEPSAASNPTPSGTSVSSGGHPSHNSSVINGVIVLVKTEKTRHPKVRLASLASNLVPEPVPITVASMQVLQQAAPTPNSITISNGIARLSLGESDRPAFIQQPSPGLLPPTISQMTPSSDPAVPASVPNQSSIRIMSRASASPVTPSQSPLPRSGASSTAALTFEEREAAYQEARMRIFAQEAGSVTAEQEAAVHATPHAANASLPGTVRRPELPQQQAWFPPDMSNGMLRPSAPSFVYGQPYQAEQMPNYGSQPYYYALPLQGYQGFDGQSGSMPQQWATSPEYINYPADGTSSPFNTMPQTSLAYSTGSNGSRPPTRPPSARRSSLSSMSNLSQSSVRTASTSSAQRSTSSRNPSGYEVRNPRQASSSSSHPPGRQTRPEAPFTPSSSNASGSFDQYSQAQSSESRLLGSSLASSVEGGRQPRQETWKGKEREITPLPDAHPSLPSRPAWLPSSKASAGPVIPSRGLAGADIAGAGEGASRDETETLASEKLGPGESPPALTPPAAPSSAASDAGSSIAPSESASQVHAKVHKPQPKIVEYPPLRYDPKRGWTTLDGGVTVASPVLSSQAASAHTARQNTVKQNKAHGQNGRRAQQQSGHHQQPHELAQGSRSAPVQLQQAVYAQQPPPGYTLQYVAVPTVQGQPMPPQPQFFYPQPYMGPAAGAYPDGQPQPLPPQGYQYVPIPVQPGQAPFYPQSPPMQQPQVYQWNGQPVQMMPMPYAMGGMTAADIMNSGEMLYSHDIPRPVPRSGATLFDPNKGSSGATASS